MDKLINKEKAIDDLLLLVAKKNKRIKELENEMARKNRLQARTYQENVKEYERQVEQIKELEKALAE